MYRICPNLGSEVEDRENKACQSLNVLLGSIRMPRLPCHAISEEVQWSYDCFSDFLDTNFRLLRADCFFPLQKGVRDFINGSLDPRDLRIYRASAMEFHVVRGSKGLVVSLEVSNCYKSLGKEPAIGRASQVQGAILNASADAKQPCVLVHQQLAIRGGPVG